MKRTKIVCTIGPASEKQATLERMMRAGMNVCRLNMSHGKYSWHEKALRTIRRAGKKVGQPIAVLVDLQGPKVRIGELTNGKQQMAKDSKVVFTSGRPAKDKIPVGHKDFHKFVKKGAHLLISDGTIECVVEKVKGRDIYAKVTLPGELKSHKGIAVQGVSLPLPSLTVKDKKDARWARNKDIDFVALSFVKRPGDVKDLRSLLKSPDLQIIVKIETKEAVKNFDSILKQADSIMIARGDLALAVGAEEVPIIQKKIIEKCRRAAKPVIVATEMLGSMEKNPRPTRAEASDVANAVIDHTDATMLSGESAMGLFPIETVATMAKIIKRTERSYFDNAVLKKNQYPAKSREEKAVFVACALTHTDQAKAIVVGSLTGRTGRLLSRYRTEIPMYVGSPDLRVVRQLALSWGIIPFKVNPAKTAKVLLAKLFAYLKKIKKKGKVVFISSEKIIPGGQSMVGMRKI